MLATNRKAVWPFLAALLWMANAGPVQAQQPKKPFTVADDIGLTLFNVQGGGLPQLHFSPDGKYFAVWTEHGRLDRNQVEDSLRFYRTQDVEAFLKSAGSRAPEPAWVATVAGKRNPLIDQWRWLGDSSGVAFLQWKADVASYQLMLADLRKRSVEPLTSSSEEVRAFDVRDRGHYIYIVANHTEWEKKRQAESMAGAFAATSTNIVDLLLPDNPMIRWTAPAVKELWAVADGKRFEVKHNGEPPVFDESAMALSPDGKFLATLAPVEEVPASWGKLYPPPPFLSYAGGGIRPQHAIQAGYRTAIQYVRIELKTGAVLPLTDAPSMDAVGIWAENAPAWSSDGEAVLLPGTFVKSEQGEPGRPCVAIVNLQSNRSRCVAMLREGYEEAKEPIDNYHEATDLIMDARFAPKDRHRVLVTFDTVDGSTGRTAHYQQGPDGAWQMTGETLGDSQTGPGGLDIKITQSFKDAPLLVAANKGLSRVLWDPNPQLKDLELGEVNIYRWKDADGKTWEGGLYKPADYQPGRRYPLVIQTHGFVESQFLPSGMMSTAFAARELAAAGIMVLQTLYPVGKGCEMDTPAEGPCNAKSLTSAANQLVADGLADPENIGVIGFSRTCYYVMEMMTTSALHLKAASITDGLMADYWQYVASGPNEEFEKMIGAKPFGEGLQEWLNRSPGFHLDKVTAPLLVVAAGQRGIPGMWLPYAGLRDLHRPVDLVVLNTDEHILTNPAERMASQGLSVDWFRFWLQGYEDPDPAKAEQYKRWRELRQLQAESDARKERTSGVN